MILDVNSFVELVFLFSEIHVGSVLLKSLTIEPADCGGMSEPLAASATARKN